MQNFEALGRYVTAKEQAEKLASECGALLSQAERLLKAANFGSGGSGYFACEFDAAEISEVINKAAQVNAQMLALIHEANSQADLCEKPKLTLFKLKGY